MQSVIQIILLVFLASYVGCDENLRSIYNFATDEGVDQTEIRNTFGKLLDAVSANKYKETWYYAGTFQSEKLKQEKAFKEWENEVKRARSRNSLNRKTAASHLHGNIVKREETETLSTEKTTPNTSRRSYAHLNAIEHQYIEQFGNDPKNVKRWEAAKDWFLEDGEPRLKKFCAEAHKRAGKGEYPIERAFLQTRLLEFKDTEYFRRIVDVVEYTIRLPRTSTENALDVFLVKQTDGPFYMAEGPQPDCVYFMNIDHLDRLLLKEYVCGIKIESDD